MSNNRFNKNKLAVSTLAALMLSPAVFAAPSALTSAITPVLQDQPQEAPTRFIITYKAASQLTMSANAANSKAKFRDHVETQLAGLVGDKLNYVREMGLAGRHVVRADRHLSAKEKTAMLNALRNDSNVASVEEDRMMHAFATPNDAQYSSQWHYFETTGGLRAPAAWDQATGAGVVVAVLDTGYRPHADLAANILPGYDMISDSFVGNDGNGRDSDAKDPGDWVNVGECGGGQPTSNQGSSWHGTHVAGTVAAVTNNGTGVAGVAYGAKVVPVRVLGKCGGYTSDIADGIIWASGGSVSGVPANPNPAKVINMSLGGSGACDSTTQAAINSARSRGTVLVIAAGNDNSNANNFNPGNCAGVVNVASVNRQGGRAYYSNYGTSVDVAAPGGAQSSANDSNGVLSTHNTGSTTPGSDTYTYMQGTSMAAPHVAGVAALIAQKKPGATPDEIESILKTTTRSFPATCSNCGTGIVDAAAAVTAAAGGSGGGTTPGTNELQNGVAITGISGSTNQEVSFTMVVPAGATGLSFKMSGGTGDADMYVKYGSSPTSSSYDCRPYLSGNNETCNISTAQAGTYYIKLVGYSAFSAVSLTGSFTEGSGGGGSTGPVTSTTSNISVSKGAWKYYTLTVPAGQTTLTINTSGGSGDADLYVRRGSQPTSSSYDCRPYKTGNTESCSFTNPTAATYYIGIYGYSAASGLTLSTSYQ